MMTISSVADYVHYISVASRIEQTAFFIDFPEMGKLEQRVKFPRKLLRKGQTGFTLGLSVYRTISPCNQSPAPTEVKVGLGDLPALATANQDNFKRAAHPLPIKAFTHTLHL